MGRVSSLLDNEIGVGKLVITEIIALWVLPCDAARVCVVFGRSSRFSQVNGMLANWERLTTMSERYGNRRRSSRLASFVALTLLAPMAVFGQPRDVLGVIVGRVYEVDPAKYEEYRRHLETREEDSDAEPELLDPDEFLNRLPDAVVAARQISTNVGFDSEFSDPDGEYMIRETPVGAYRFTIAHEGIDYPVRQILDLNVELSYIAELCFVVDPETKVAWMVSEGMRRDPAVPPFVPERCQSALSGCLALLTGNPDGFPNGLLLLLAGSAAAAATLGIISLDQTEASSPVPQ